MTNIAKTKKKSIKIRAKSKPDFDSSEVQFPNKVSETEVVKPVRENNEKALLNASGGDSDGVWTWDMETNQVFFSKQWKAILGYEESEIGNTLEEWTKRVHSDDLELALKAVERYMNGEVDLYQSVHRIKCKNGKYIWVLDEGKIIDYEGIGKVSLVVGTHLNIKQHLKKTTELEERLKELNCHNQISKILADPELSTDEVIDRIVQIIPPGMQFPHLAEASVEINNQTYQTPNFIKSNQSLTQDIKLKDKIIGCVEVCYPDDQIPVTYPVFLMEETELLFSVAERIGKFIERKENETALNQSEDKFRMMVETIDEIIYDFSVDGFVNYISPSIKRILGYEPEELIGKKIFDIVHEADRAILAERLALPDTHMSSFEYRFITKSGEIRWLRKSTVSLRKEGYLISKVGTLTDITESKQTKDFENELLKLSPKLTGTSLSEIDNTLNLALNKIGEFLAAGRAYVFEFSTDESTFSNTYEWCSNDTQPEIRNMQEIPAVVFPMLISTLRNHEDILIPSVTDLPDGWHAEREFFLSRSIRSLILIPIFTEAKLIGFVGLDSVRDRKIYTASEINNLKIWSSLIGSLIKSKRIERAFQQTKKNYETFFNTIDEFVWVLDEKGNIIDVNKSVTEKLKFSFGELYNQSILTVHPKERIEDAARISEEMLAGTTEISMIPLLTKSGTQVPVETHVKQGFWDEKPVMFAVSKDISQIMLSEQKFSTAFHSNPAMMAIVELNTGKFVDINNAFIETMGFQRDEIIGKTSKELNLFIDFKLKYKLLKQINHNQPIKKLEHLFLTKDGRKRTGIMSSDLIYIGEKRCLLVVSSDITEIKEAELETKKARIEAEEASKSKSEFLSRMSHELRTPLNAILGFAQLLEMGELNTSQKKGVDRILQGGKNLLELINEVLDITRIDTGNLSLLIEPVRIGNLFPEMIDTIQPLVRERQVTLNVSDDMINRYSVKADRKRLLQVLLNLLNNAVKYNNVGGSVSVITEIIPKENNLKYVRISVTDTGPGIENDDIHKLFKPFERVGNHQNAPEGTGLGLAVVKKLVDAMEGYVGVESKFGEGSTFWIELPHAEIQLKAKAKANDHPL